MPPRSLTKVERAYRLPGGSVSTGSTVQTLTYDGLGRRITKAVDNCGDWDATFHTYLDGQRMIELRDGSDDVLKQYVWGTQYVDELVQIGINVGYTTEGNDDREHFFCALQDAHYNVLAVICGIDGRLVERYEFTPYGRRTVFSHGWATTAQRPSQRRPNKAHRGRPSASRLWNILSWLLDGWYAGGAM